MDGIKVSVSFFFFQLIKKIINLFLAVLGLHCCMQAFSSCGKRGLLSSCNSLVVLRGFSLW